jgi:hypothetical protein
MPKGARLLGSHGGAGRLRPGGIPFLWIVAALVGLLIALPPATAQQATGAAPDTESEPDLTGLLAATKGIRMTKVEPGLAVGAAEYPPFGIRILADLNSLRAPHHQRLL